MRINHILAVVPVTNIEIAREFYERVFGRDPDNHPMDNLVEWNVTGSGWLQVFVDSDKAGASLVNFAVDDLASHVEELWSRGLSPDPVQSASNGVELATIHDPDGNTITFIGNFRVAY